LAEVQRQFSGESFISSTNVSGTIEHPCAKKEHGHLPHTLYKAQNRLLT
jgi:hypothetical protein